MSIPEPPTTPEPKAPKPDWLSVVVGLMLMISNRGQDSLWAGLTVLSKLPRQIKRLLTESPELQLLSKSPVRFEGQHASLLVQLQGYGLLWVGGVSVLSSIWVRRLLGLVAAGVTLLVYWSLPGMMPDSLVFGLVFLGCLSALGATQAKTTAPRKMSVIFPRSDVLVVPQDRSVTLTLIGVRGWQHIPLFVAATVDSRLPKATNAEDSGAWFANTLPPSPSAALPLTSVGPLSGAAVGINGPDVAWLRAGLAEQRELFTTERQKEHL